MKRFALAFALSMFAVTAAFATPSSPLQAIDTPETTACVEPQVVAQELKTKNADLWYSVTDPADIVSLKNWLSKKYSTPPEYFKFDIVELYSTQNPLEFVLVIYYDGCFAQATPVEKSLADEVKNVLDHE